jgi:hypothetical protein
MIQANVIMRILQHFLARWQRRARAAETLSAAIR